MSNRTKEAHRSLTSHLEGLPLEIAARITADVARIRERFADSPLMADQPLTPDIYGDAVKLIVAINPVTLDSYVDIAQSRTKAEVAAMIAARVGLPFHEVCTIAAAGLLDDIGQAYSHRFITSEKCGDALLIGAGIRQEIAGPVSLQEEIAAVASAIDASTQDFDPFSLSDSTTDSIRHCTDQLMESLSLPQMIIILADALSKRSHSLSPALKSNLVSGGTVLSLDQAIDLMLHVHAHRYYDESDPVTHVLKGTSHQSDPTTKVVRDSTFSSIYKSLYLRIAFKFFNEHNLKMVDITRTLSKVNRPGSRLTTVANVTDFLFHPLSLRILEEQPQPFRPRR